MTLKRYDLNELIALCENIFCEQMAGDSVLYDRGQVKRCSESNPTLAHLVHDEYKNVINEFQNQHVNLKNALRTTCDNILIKMIEEQIDCLTSEYNILVNLNSKKQKEVYNNSYDLRLSRSKVTFPLNKLINSFYDDLSLEVLFYDDVCTPGGLFHKYENLKSFEERKAFIKKHTEITHMALLFNSPRTTVPVAITVIKGEMRSKNTYNGIYILGKEFGDFKNLSLYDIDKVANNDLKQMLQSKIDLDKEGMDLLYSENIRGDEYWLYKRRVFTGVGSNSTDYYVRYICSSTGRVYFNKLILQNLALSEYYSGRDFRTYLRAWWSLTHLGASVDGNAVISC